MGPQWQGLQIQRYTSSTQKDQANCRMQSKEKKKEKRKKKNPSGYSARIPSKLNHRVLC